MSGLEINASKISNTVTFKVDQNSFKEAKNSVLAVKKLAENIKPAMDMSKLRQQMKEYKLMMQQATAASKHMPGPTPSAPKGGRPSSPTGGSSRPPKQTPEDKRAERLAKRGDIGDLRMENFEKKARDNFSKADNALKLQAQQIVGKTVDLYKREEITLQRLNQVLSHQLDDLRRSHREKNATLEDEARGIRKAARIREAEDKRAERARQKHIRDLDRIQKREAAQTRRDRERRYDQFKEGAVGLNPRMMVSSLIGAGLFAGGAAVGNTLNTANDRIKYVSRGAENVQTNSNAILAMTAWGEQNGVDSANIIKSIDNIKDVRERLGNTMMNTKWNAKEGKWKGGDNGINDIMNTFGWNPDQIKHMQNDPLSFIQATVKEGEKRGMNSAQIGRLLENLGDDLMHYQRMFSKGGAGFQETMKMLERTGAALTAEQIEASKEYTRMTAIMGLVGQGMQNNFLEGFMKTMEGAPDFTNNTKLFMKTSQELGMALGALLNAVGKTIDWLNNLNPENKHEELDSSGLYYKDSFVGDLVGWGKNFLGLPDLPGEGSKDLPSWAGTGDTFMPAYRPNADLLRDSLNPMSTPPTSAQQYQVNPVFNVTMTQEVPVTIQSDVSRLSDYIDWNAKASADSFTKSLTLNTLSGQSSSSN